MVDQQALVARQGHCYCVQSDQMDAQVEEVFWYFNVDQDDKYLFSRCQACNGDKYVTLTSYQVRRLANILNTQQNKLMR